MGAMKPNQHFSHRYDVKLKSVELTGYFGYTKFHDQIYNYIVDMNFGLNNKTFVQFKVPYAQVYGKLANTNGLGDLSIAFTRTVLSKENYQVGVTLGTKIPSNNANRKEDGRSLPMYYQTSLGTYDYIFGTSLISKKWLFATGFQGTFNKTGNHFKWGIWSNSDQFQIARLYPVSDNLKRGNDVMLRVERNFRFARFNFFSGLLPIYRINKDEITNPKDGKRVKVDGSNGLAMTWLNGFGYRLTAKSSIKVLGGISVVRRKTNPDGLSREYVFTLTCQYRY